MRNLQLTTQNRNLPQLGILTHVEELANYDMIYIYHQLQKGTELRIERDEKRTWDENALAIYFKGFKLGYVSKRTSGMVQKCLNKGNYIYASIKSLSKQKYSPFTEMDIQIHVH